MKQFHKTLLKITIGLLLFAALYVATKKYVSLDAIKTYSGSFKQMVVNHYVAAAVIFNLLFFIAMALSLPIMIPLTLLSGFLFGVVPGTIYAVLSTLAGCVVSFLIFRYFLVARLRTKYAPQIAQFNKKMQEYGPSYILILHYSAVIPFFMINSCAALTDISLVKFTIVTLLGLVPVCLIYAFAGKELSTIHAVNDIFSPWVVTALVLLFMLALVPVMINKFRKK